LTRFVLPPRKRIAVRFDTADTARSSNDLRGTFKSRLSSADFGLGLKGASVEFLESEERQLLPAIPSEISVNPGHQFVDPTTQNRDGAMYIKRRRSRPERVVAMSAPPAVMRCIMYAEVRY
jgi:hypothetical protein